MRRPRRCVRGGRPPGAAGSPVAPRRALGGVPRAVCRGPWRREPGCRPPPTPARAGQSRRRTGRGPEWRVLFCRSGSSATRWRVVDCSARYCSSPSLVCTARCSRLAADGLPQPRLRHVDHDERAEGDERHRREEERREHPGVEVVPLLGHGCLPQRAKEPGPRLPGECSEAAHPGSFRARCLNGNACWSKRRIGAPVRQGKPGASCARDARAARGGRLTAKPALPLHFSRCVSQSGSNRHSPVGGIARAHRVDGGVGLHGRSAPRGLARTGRRAVGARQA